MSEDILWAPSEAFIATTRMAAFQRVAQTLTAEPLPDYHALWRWSVAHPAAFWAAVWDFCGIIGERGDRVLVDGERMPGARWFPDARLNFAENLLRGDGHGDALVFWGEDRLKRRMSHRQLRAQVAACQQALLAVGVEPGDRVAGYLPNMPETVVAMLAATALGAVWCSASPDFGVEGVLDRFGQIEPKVMFCVDGYVYNGKVIDCMAKNRAVAARLPSLARTVVVSYLADITGAADAAVAAGALQAWRDFLAPTAAPLRFRRVAFDHPLYILFSSGTTGAPKCIVHSVGGTLIQHLKEHQLHADVRPGDRLFYFTTCGWMMWNWLVSGLASGATLLLYDGSPWVRQANGDNRAVVFDLAQAEGMTQLGVAAKFIETCEKLGLHPARTHDLTSLRSVLSTGSPLSAEGFDYVYGKVKATVMLASISGGTDIVSCFALGSPILSVRRGALQCRGLGMAVAVFNDAGESLVGEKGELVCTRPFPSMPIGFWRDADGAKYRRAYFERFDRVWHHGDFVELTPQGGMVIYGRSDAVLNPGGVRIGTAEIYRQVAQLDAVLESIVIGQQWRRDVRVVLFVKLRAGLTLDAPLVDDIKARIRAGATPRHVPAKVVQVADIPRTKSGKLVELAVRDVVHGRPVKNRESLENPEALRHFADLAALRS